MQAAAEVASVISVVNRWQEHFASQSVSASDVAILAERIDGEDILVQRSGFDTLRSRATAAKKKRVSPFRRG